MRYLTALAGLLSLGLAATVAVAPARADIRTFNAAVQAGDYRAALIEANATWSTIDLSAPDAAAITREFGWIAMLAGDSASALVYGRFLVEEGATLPHPDTEPHVSRVLYAWAQLANSPSPTTRDNLLASLRSRATTTSRDLISARAAQGLGGEAWGVGAWGEAEGAGMYVLRFLDDLGAGATPARFEARRQIAMANFMRTSSPEAYNALYDIAAELHDLIATTPAGPGRHRLGQEYYAATSWGDAVYAALSGANQRAVPDRRHSINAGRTPMAELLYPAPGDQGLPRCRISLAPGAKAAGFPFVAQFRELGGSVTYALDLAPNGAFTNPRVLAAAPHPDFAKATREVMGTWRWRIEGTSQPPFCRMPQTHVMTFEFTLGR